MNFEAIREHAAENSRPQRFGLSARGAEAACGALNHRPSPKGKTPPDAFADLNESGLIQALRSQGPQAQRAFSRLLEKSLPLLRSKLQRSFQDKQEAEDVLGETLLAVAGAMEGFRGDARLTTWLYSVMQNKICDHIGKLQRRRRLAEAWVHRDTRSDEDGLADPPTAWDVSPDRLCDMRRLQACIAQALKHLPEADAHAWTLREVEGLSAERAAEKLCISAEAYRVRLFRARQKLAQSVKFRLGCREKSRPNPISGWVGRQAA